MRPVLLFVFLIAPALTTGPCNCNPSTVWLDIMIIFDSSTATGYKGLQEMLGYVQTAFSFVNVQDATCIDDFHTRVGIIVYASQASVLYPLGSLDGDQLMDIMSLPFYNDSGTNIEQAFLLADKQFNTTAHRPNARQVIFLLATAYNQGGYNAPQQMGTTFKENGGIIVVYNYQQVHGIATPELVELASPGYFIANYIDGNTVLARKALCDANCFCPNGLYAVTLDNMTNVPTTGCFYNVNIGISETLASVRCNQFNEGTMVIADTAEKTALLQKHFLAVGDFWTSLRWNSTTNNYVWVDGTVLQNNAYQPWKKGAARSENIDCVGTARTTLEWQPMDCRSALLYACENSACDSTNYCV